MNYCAQFKQEISHWKLSRILWRAGELRIKGISDVLVKLQGFSKDELFIYSWIWAFGRCGNQNDRGLVSQYINESSAELSHWIARCALFNLSNDAQQKELYLKSISTLPQIFAKQITESRYSELQTKVGDVLVNMQARNNEFLGELYLISLRNPDVKKIVLEVLRETPEFDDLFTIVRKIFKAAEFFDDFETIAVLNRRLEKEFSTRTIQYFKKRVQRLLRRSGEIGNSIFYTGLASAILLEYDEEKDKLNTRKMSIYNWQSGHYVSTWFGEYSKYNALNYIIHGSSNRITQLYNLKWVYAPGITPEMPKPSTREEAFPELWGHHPQKLVEILLRSRVEIIDEFAVLALSGRQDLREVITDENLALLLQKKYDVTNAFALKLIKEFYPQGTSNGELIVGLLHSPNQEARTLGIQWVERYLETNPNPADTFVAIFTTPYPDVHQWALTTTAIRTKLRRYTDTVVLGIIQYYIKQDPNETKSLIESSRQSAALAIGLLENKVSSETFEHLIKQLESNKEHVLILASTLIVHFVDSYGIARLPESILPNLLSSESSAVRAIGVELFGKYDDETLLTKKHELLNLCVVKDDEIRERVYPVITRLAKAHREFAEDLFVLFVPIITQKQKYKSVNKVLYQLLGINLREYHSTMNDDTMWLLLNARGKWAQMLGLEILGSRKPEDLDWRHAITLGNHALVDIRNFVKRAFDSNPEKAKAHQESVLGLLDSRWDDTRQFTFNFIEQNFHDEDWTPEAIIGICDSVKPDVQQFGRKLVTRFFQEQHSQEYLVKLSQHPTVAMQEFVTNFLVSSTPQTIRSELMS